MGKSSKKPRAKFDPNKFQPAAEKAQKKEKDWTFEDMVRAKTRRH